MDVLEQYEPPTVTQVQDARGRILGELFEKRRYVVSLDQIPDVVQNAFVASEDASFWEHGGIDWMGVGRAVVRNVAAGRKAQGGSTITQQVARNFLLSDEKVYSRKIKEVILARRIERTFDKQHILFLYLNQIYLGSGAYGVEAASRIYLGKHVQDLDIAEAALLAGLPQRPSDDSPFNSWENARERQLYVLGQMLDKGFLDRDSYDQAVAEPVDIVRDEAAFTSQAPYFTEHVRRYLVDTYGSDKVYNDGLVVESTCDLDLQKTAQEAVIRGVTEADDILGWRGPKEHIEAAAIPTWLESQEMSLRKQASQAVLRVAGLESGKGGNAPLPDLSEIQAGHLYDAVVMEVNRSRAIVGIGRHRALMPLQWTRWASTVGSARSLDDMSRAFKPGDVVQVTIEALWASDLPELGRQDSSLAAARLYQAPEMQGALLSFRLSDGAVVAMVGGVDFEKTEYNRAIQAERQVGSTFKPIVYAAAIASRLFTTGSLIQDAPTVYNVLDGELWKPGNFSGEYLGNITLHRALQLSRNVCTVRILDRIGLDGVFDLGDRLRIGYDMPKCTRRLVAPTDECLGLRRPSLVTDRAWCEICDPESCPLVAVDAETKCLDEVVQRDGDGWCHSCDVNKRLCAWLPIEEIPPTDNCVDKHRDEKGRIVCRSCDLSMGLGSSSLTMLELSRAYSAFATYGHLVEPHWINRVLDRDGTVLEEWAPPGSKDGKVEWPQVMDPTVAGIAHWMLEEVARGGTAGRSQALRLHVAGKTGTTNESHDAWFVGYTPDLMAAVWVGYDTPKNMGGNATGGHRALPIWMEYMKVAAPRELDRPFPSIPGAASVPVDESTGRVAIGGTSMPMLPDTVPDEALGAIGQQTVEDLLITNF